MASDGALHLAHLEADHPHDHGLHRLRHRQGQDPLMDTHLMTDDLLAACDAEDIAAGRTRRHLRHDQQSAQAVAS